MKCRVRYWVRRQSSNLNWVFSAAPEDTNASQQTEWQTLFNIGKTMHFPTLWLNSFVGLFRQNVSIT